MLKIIATVALAIAAPLASAAECWPPLSKEDARSAQAVFVFQVVSAEYRRGSESPLGDFVVAKLRVVDRIRGKTAATHMSYYLGPECGPKVIPGSFYAAFLPKPSRSFVGSAVNLVAVGRTYAPAEDRPALAVVAAGGQGAEKTLDYSRSWLAQIPSPPPPCLGKGVRHGP